MTSRAPYVRATLKSVHFFVYGKLRTLDQNTTCPKSNQAHFMPRTLTPFLLAHLAKTTAAVPPLALVRVEQVSGSAPRDAGTQMIVTSAEVTGTIGGGRLEWDAIAAARALLLGNQSVQIIDIVLGPALGQCCGGRVTLRIVRLDRSMIEAILAEEAAIQRATVYIYGAGHVGRALATALAPLPLAVSLIDSRQDELSIFTAGDVSLLHTEKPLSVAENAPDGSAHVIMTHSHALDSLIAATVLEQNSFGYLGIIGSRTKRNSFRKAFREIGIPADRIARVICPIGSTGVKDKRPEVIAALVAAEIVVAMSDSKTGRKP
jgi:xanthine dehydrogenase accessory factor